MFCKNLHKENIEKLNRLELINMLYVQFPILSEISYTISQKVEAGGYVSRVKQKVLHDKLMTYTKNS